jgi:hydantoinase/carbamoylase family amidase
MPIRAERLADDIAAIARCTDSPGAGADRPTFSTAWRAARDYCVGEAERAGCRWRIDAAGNVHIRPAAVDWSSRVWMSGSHVDSVPHGGDFDGVVGVVAALETLRAACEDGRRDLPLEAVIFAEEEGTTFGLGMLGSRGWAGTLDSAALAALRNRDGLNYWEAGHDHGAAAHRLAEEELQGHGYAGFIEVHVEQGPGMWKRDERVALVTAINGRRQYAVSLRGAANHAGSTGMNDRHDALAGAAEVIAAVECLPDTLGEHAVATVGRIAVEPNAVNVIPGAATFTIDLRASNDHELETGDARIRALVAAAAARRGLEAEVRRTESLPAVRLDPQVAARVREASLRLGLSPLPETASGALHDAAILAPLVPTVMLFVASRDGISHNPAEFSRIDDVAVATRLLAEVVADLPESLPATRR